MGLNAHIYGTEHIVYLRDLACMSIDTYATENTLKSNLVSIGQRLGILRSKQLVELYQTLFPPHNMHNKHETS